MLAPVNSDGEKDQTPLLDLANYLSEDMVHVNKVILDKMTSDVPLITNIAGYLIASGGKRLRPLLTLAVTSALGGDMPRAHGLAAIVEFIHSATLLHDDVVDGSHERRGKEAANDIFGNQASVLVGDFLFSRAFQLMVADGSLKTLKILSDASAIIAEGEVMQLQMQGNLDTSWEQYLAMIGAKTAALFAAACEVGAVVSEAEEKTQKAMHDFGYNLGIAFQIADDVLDYDGDQAALGKMIGDDFREGKISAPVLLSYKHADDSQRAFWYRTMTERRQTPDDLQTAQGYIILHDSISKGLAEAKSYALRAHKALEKTPPSLVKDMLEQITDYVVTRNV